MLIFLLLCYASNAHHFNDYATKNLIIMLNIMLIDRVQMSPQSQPHPAHMTDHCRESI